MACERVQKWTRYESDREGKKGAQKGKKAEKEQPKTWTNPSSYLYEEGLLDSASAWMSALPLKVHTRATSFAQS